MLPWETKESQVPEKLEKKRNNIYRVSDISKLKVTVNQNKVLTDLYPTKLRLLKVILM